ncbi:MAG: cyclase family protein [Bacteroidota bacterium]
MLATITYKGKEYKIDLFQPIDISIPLHTGENCVNAWYVPPMSVSPVVIGDWVGEVNMGGSVNFRNITFNPHGNGTHTECVGHISKENFTINQTLKRFFFTAQLVTVLPESIGDDLVITLASLKSVLSDFRAEALVIRTLSNSPVKMNMQYSNTNPPYLQQDAIEYIVELGFDHLLIDLPSVDKEKDEGKLLGHHAFWTYPDTPNTIRTITELIYVPNHIMDGIYILNLQIAPFENDASPSKPILYAPINPIY